MNAEQRLNEVAEAIKTRSLSVSERWVIIYESEKICCIPAANLEEHMFILGKFTSVELDAGLSTRQWNKLKARIMDATKGGLVR